MSEFDGYVRRYREGEWRASVFRDMILADLARLPDSPAVLDIGCGRGFDDSLELQAEIAGASGRYIGIEPDPESPLAPFITESHRCVFEEATLPPASVHLAFAVMVLEHIREPARFWTRLETVLADGGVFWGFTVDARHWFCRLSLWMERLRLKDLYLDRLRGPRGTARYHNYPVFYRANSPGQVLPWIRRFRRHDFVSFSRAGQLDYYVPRVLRPLSAMLERRRIARNKPGLILAIRIEKGRAPDLPE